MDQAKYINAYVNSAVAQLQEHVAMDLQMKAKVSVMEEMIADKDKYIGILQQQLEAANAAAEQAYQNAMAEANKANSKLAEYEELKSKANHIDTFTAQIKDMKYIIQVRDKEVASKDKEIEALKKELEDLKKPKKEEPIKKSKKKVLHLEESVLIKPFLDEAISDAPKKLPNLVKVLGDQKETVTSTPLNPGDDF